MLTPTPLLTWGPVLMVYIFKFSLLLSLKGKALRKTFSHLSLCTNPPSPSSFPFPFFMFPFPLPPRIGMGQRGLYSKIYIPSSPVCSPPRSWSSRGIPWGWAGRALTSGTRPAQCSLAAWRRRRPWPDSGPPAVSFDSGLGCKQCYGRILNLIQG